jgi:small subunit ribosomal protein S17
MNMASSSDTKVVADAKPTTRPLIGRVVSDKMNKTVTVLVERRVKHPLYDKYIRRSSRIHAHDETDDCNVGDSVSIVQCRPLSKTKAWTVHEIVARAK